MQPGISVTSRDHKANILSWETSMEELAAPLASMLFLESQRSVCMCICGGERLDLRLQKSFILYARCLMFFLVKSKKYAAQNMPENI